MVGALYSDNMDKAIDLDSLVKLALLDKSSVYMTICILFFVR